MFRYRRSLHFIIFLFFQLILLVCLYFFLLPFAAVSPITVYYCVWCYFPFLAHLVLHFSSSETKNKFTRIYIFETDSLFSFSAASLSSTFSSSPRSRGMYPLHARLFLLCLTGAANPNPFLRFLSFQTFFLQEFLNFRRSINTQGFFITSFLPYFFSFLIFSQDHDRHYCSQGLFLCVYVTLFLSKVAK